MSSKKPEISGLYHRIFILSLVLLSVFSAALLFFSLPWAIGVSSDSVSYLRAASRFSASPDLSHFPSHWPPMYPLLLATFNIFIGDILFSAKMFQVLCFSLNVFLFSQIIYNYSQHQTVIKPVIALMGGLFFMINYPVFFLHQHALSEAIFLFFLLTGFLFFSFYFKTERAYFLIIAALAFGFSVVTRYAAIVFIPAASLFLLLNRCETFFNLKERWKEALIFVLLSSLPIFTWLISNSLLRGQSTNRTLIFNPATFKHLEDLLNVYSNWLQVPYVNWLSPPLVLLLAGFLCWALVFSDASSTCKRIVGGLLICFLAYITFIFISISFIDAYTPVDRRILLPAWLLLFLAIFLLLLEFWSKKALTVPLMVVLLMVMLVNIGQTKDQFQESVSRGIGFLQKGAAQSPLLQLVVQREKMAGKTKTIYTNAADYVFILTGEEVEKLPPTYLPVKKTDNPEFLTKMVGIVEQVDKSQAVIVYFNKFSWRQYYLRGDQYQQLFSLGSSYQFPDGYYFDKWIEPRSVSALTGPEADATPAGVKPPAKAVP